MSDFDPLSQLPSTSPKSRRIADPTAGRTGKTRATAVTTSAKAAIPESMKAGEYVRQTITVPPDQRDLIKKLAEENKVSLLGLYRWLLDQGLQAYEGGKRPEPTEPVYRDMKMGHWSSKTP